jgi:predicted dehydrogenase
MPWKGRDTHKGDTVFIPEGWAPTADNLNALPMPLRHFIHALHTECDPAGTIRENVLNEEENYALHKMIEELKGRADSGP